MPLRQSMLTFKDVSFLTSLTALPQIPAEQSDVKRQSTTSDTNDIDTIVVDVQTRNPLPTPSESTADSASESGQIFSLKKVSRSQNRRVTRVQDQSQDYLLETTGAQSRSVSGDTLVQSMSQPSVLQDGITALNLPWSMSSIFVNGSKGELVKHEKAKSIESIETDTNEENEQEKEERAVARRAKMHENARLREEKIKAADEKATRRSSRASMLGKAGDIVSSLANNVLSKRLGLDQSDGLAKRANLRPRSMMELNPSDTSVFERSTTKKRRMSDVDIEITVSADEETLAQRRRSIQKRKDKRWLVSGLYTGQVRTFDPRLKESRNRRKTAMSTDEPKQDNKVMPLPMFAGERLLKQGRDFKLPFDVFSPLPGGQPKPDEWRKTNKNVFVGEAGELWRIHKFQEQSTCMCQPETGCDNDCMNRFMYYECDEKNCNLTEEQCGNRAFEGLRQRAKKGGKYNVGVEVIKTTDRGYGVRSNRTFDPNQIIVEYTGEIITQEECEDRMHSIYKDNECYYLMLFDQNMIIDATRGSIARFVNHSCEPNCRMEKWTVDGKPRMALFAGDKGIMTAEELTYDYNFDPYSQKNVQICRCGAKSCRGVLGPKPKDGPKQKAEEDNRPESRLAGAKRKIAQVLDESTSRLNKKRKVTLIDSKNSTLDDELPLRKTMLHSHQSLGRSSSKLRRIINGAKEEANSNRVASGASGQVLIGKSAVKGLARNRSVRERAETLRRSVIRTVRGAVNDSRMI